MVWLWLIWFSFSMCEMHHIHYNIRPYHWPQFFHVLLQGAPICRLNHSNAQPKDLRQHFTSVYVCTQCAGCVFIYTCTCIMSALWIIQYLQTCATVDLHPTYRSPLTQLALAIPFSIQLYTFHHCSWYNVLNVWCNNHRIPIQLVYFYIFYSSVFYVQVRELMNKLLYVYVHVYV